MNEFKKESSWIHVFSEIDKFVSADFIIFVDGKEVHSKEEWDHGFFDDEGRDAQIRRELVFKAIRKAIKLKKNQLKK